MSKRYMNKENRDAAYREMPDKKLYRRTSSRNQLMHPMYIEDYEKETGHSLTPADKGFGNTIYKTHFKVVYSIARRG